MWVRRSHVLAPLAHLTSNKVKWNWGPKQSAAFAMAKRIIAKETMLAYPDFGPMTRTFSGGPGIASSVVTVTASLSGLQA